jgi:hypothetical protein
MIKTKYLIENSIVILSMFQECLQISLNQFLFLFKSDFHKIDQLIQAKDKTFEINVCSKSFFFSKEQIILFSVKSFLSILESHHSFNISAPSNISEDLIISCFENIFYLFSRTSEIQISQNNVIPFLYLSEEFKNSNLFSLCEEVKSSGESQSFFLTSKAFHQISKDILHSLNDFGILLNDCKIECNPIFASLISNKIFHQIGNSPNNALIDLSVYPYSEIIKILFGILQGNVIEINESNMEQVLEAIYFLEFDSLSVHNILNNFPFNFVLNDISSLHCLSNYLIQKIISSSFLHLQNENRLFEFIGSLIKENREYLNYLKYISFGLVTFLDFQNLINSIHFREFNSCLFDHMKSSLFSNYFLSFERSIHSDEIQSIRLFSKYLKIVLKKRKKINILNLFLNLTQFCLKIFCKSILSTKKCYYLLKNKEILFPNINLFV